MDLLCIRGYTVYNGRRYLLLRFVRWFIVCQRFLSLLNYKDKAVAQIMHFNMLLLMTNKRIVKNRVTLQLYSLNLLKTLIYICTPCKSGIFDK